VQSRSAAQQIAHWARIGREIEASASISHREIAAVLAGSRSYDDLGPKEQAVVRAEWSARMDEARAALDLAEDFARAGRSWVELDARGRVVERGGPAPSRAATTSTAGTPAPQRRRVAAAARGSATTHGAPASPGSEPARPIRAGATRTAGGPTAPAGTRTRRSTERATG
jgi:hypothetical protein